MFQKVKVPVSELFRFVVSGVVATGVHYLALTIAVIALMVKPVGLANFFAASIGITVSFLGNRFYVFPHQKKELVQQASLFVVFYGLLALLQGFELFLWTDILKLDYRVGFVLATAFQFGLTFVGNKKVVFRK